MQGGEKSNKFYQHCGARTLGAYFLVCLASFWLQGCWQVIFILNILTHRHILVRVYLYDNTHTHTFAAIPALFLPTRFGPGCHFKTFQGDSSRSAGSQMNGCCCGRRFNYQARPSGERRSESAEVEGGSVKECDGVSVHLRLAYVKLAKISY